MKRTIGLIFFLLSIKVLSQTENLAEFYPLTPIDTIHNFKELNKSERIDILNSTDYFFTYKDREYKNGLHLTKKYKDKWIIYEFDSDIFSLSNTTIGNFRLEDEKYIVIQVFRSPSGACSNTYGFLTILNIKTCKTIEFCNYNYQECYDDSAKVSSQTECETTTTLENEILTLKMSGDSDGLQCIQSAEYKMNNDGLIKTKYYLDSHKRFYSIICNEEYDICTGMDFKHLKKKFSNEMYNDAPAFAYGYDSETIGQELHINNELELFVLIQDNDIITGISFISPRYKFDTITTNSKVSEVINKYPLSKLHIDLITDWEYIYLNEHKIRYVFKTDRDSRIGVYESDFEKGTRNINRPNVKIDFIQI